MAATVGPAPWDQEAYSTFRAGYKRLGAKGRERLGVNHDPAGGYRVGAGKVGSTRMRTLTMSDGTQVQVPQNDYEDFIGFNKADEDTGADQIRNYIEGAFVEGTVVRQVKGVGHIAFIKYSARRQVLWVEFKKGDSIVAFLRVPKAVYSELEHLALSGGIQLDRRGKERHTLGIRFWDIVRIRGTQHGARYRFIYMQQYDAGLEQERKVLTEAERRAIEHEDLEIMEGYQW